jgi:predicted dehydrogenase
MSAFCDVDSKYLAQARKKFPKAKFYRDWREMYEKELPVSDSVCVGAPDHHHVAMATAAMKAGKHVYLEKPMAKTMVEAKFLRDVAAKSGVVTQMGTQYNAYASDRQVIRMLKAKTLGPVEHVYLHSTRKGLSRRRRLLPKAAPVPENLDWDLWLGSAAERPYAPGVYHPLIWRIWRDLGSGWIGDIGCHLIAAVWRGMELGGTPVKSVLADTLTDAEDAVKDLVWPTAAHIVFDFEGVPATDGRPFKLEWFDGCSAPDNLAPARFRPPAEIDAMYAKTPWGERPFEGKAIKCRDGWILQPHGADFTWAFRNDGSIVVPPVVGPASSHYHEYISCAIAGKKAATDFGWSTYMRECVIAGEIAERVQGTKITWDAKTRRFDSAAANEFLTRPYRKGWEIPGMVG